MSHIFNFTVDEYTTNTIRTCGHNVNLLQGNDTCVADKIVNGIDYLFYCECNTNLCNANQSDSIKIASNILILCLNLGIILTLLEYCEIIFLGKIKMTH